MIIYKKTSFLGKFTTAFLGGLCKIVNYKWIKSYYICGIKVFSRHVSANDKIQFLIRQGANKTNEDKLQRFNNINMDAYYANMVANQHQKVFPQFKNIHKDKIGVLVGSGPTLRDYVPIENAIHIGVNSTITNDKIKLDYWLCCDNAALGKIGEKYLNNSDAVKLFGQHAYLFNLPPDKLKRWHIPDSTIEKYSNSHKFYILQLQLQPQLDSMPLAVLKASSIFCALQFILWTGVKKLYLAGVDASSNGYFNAGQQNSNEGDNLKRAWMIAKDFIDVFYPDVEMISINPVGLKGIFKEVCMK